jgi:hypothetical protein
MLVSDAYLRRWLVARDWDVAVTHKLLVDHGAWRDRNSPAGYVEEDRVRAPIDDNKVFLQVRGPLLGGARGWWGGMQVGSGCVGWRGGQQEGSKYGRCLAARGVFLLRP